MTREQLDALIEYINAKVALEHARGRTADVVVERMVSALAILEASTEQKA